MAVSQTKKLRWFDRGTAVFEQRDPGKIAARFGPETPPCYVCPICTGLFKRQAVLDGYLTAEDVPPKSLGGRPLLLTCRRCNSTSGSVLDAQARRKQNILDAVHGRPGDARYVILAIDDHEVRAEFKVHADATLLRVRLDWNPPGASEVFGSKLKGRTPIKVTFRGDRYSDLGAKVSWLRSAYLAMFARFGYDVVFAPAMQVVRQQIMDPRERLMVSFTIEIPEYVPLSFRRILKAETPAWLNCWVVQFGQYCVLLPEPKDATLYDRIESNLTTERNSISGENYGWPVEPFIGL